MIDKLRRIPSVVVFVAVLIIVPIVCLATGITSITSAPDPPVIGYGATYTIHVDPTDTVLSYSFQYQCTEGVTSAWAPIPADTNSTGVFSYIEMGFGNQNLKGGEQISTGLYPPRSSWTYLTKSITIGAPNTETITAGLNTDSTLGSDGSYNVDVDFSISVGGSLVGPYANPSVEERIRRPPGFDSGWVGASAQYSWQNPYGYIYDHKRVIDISGFAGLPAGTVFDDFYQQNRMTINDCMGIGHIIYFTEHHFQRKKTGTTTWQLIEL